MAELVIPTGYGMWNFELQHAGIQHTAIVTLGFMVATPPYTQAQAQGALSAFTTAMAPLHDSEVTYSRVVVNVGNDGPPLRYEASGVGTGSRSSVQVLPPNITYLLRKVTAYAGRRYRGRMYVPFVSSTDTGTSQTGSLSSAAQILLDARGTALMTGMVGAGPNASQLVLLHATGNTPTPSPTTLESIDADDFVATQRRRLVRV